MAAISALEALKRPCQVHLIGLGLHEGRHHEMDYGLEEAELKTSAGKPVKNQDLWERLDRSVAGHDIHWGWVKGHAGDPGNEKADELANKRGVVMLRQVVLDTETTGIEPELGHRIIEIGCVELVNRRLTGRVYHEYLQPDREIDQGAFEVHGISNEFLADKPRFNDVADGFLEFIDGAELVIHNAAFDVGFLDAELARIPGKPKIKDVCHGGEATDSLLLARKSAPTAQ